MELRQVLRLEVPEPKRESFDRTARQDPLDYARGCGHIDAYKAIKAAFLELGFMSTTEFSEISDVTPWELKNHMQVCIQP